MIRESYDEPNWVTVVCDECENEIMSAESRFKLLKIWDKRLKPSGGISLEGHLCYECIDSYFK